jgi:uncharacterized membrane protein YkoI
MSRLPRDIRSVLSDKQSAIRPAFERQLRAKLFKGEPQMTKKTTSKLFTRAHLLPLAGASLVLASLVGTGSFLYSKNRSEQSSLRQVELPTNLSGIKSVDEIRNLTTALPLTGQTVSSFELENEEGALLYKVKYSDGSFKLFNARSGELFNKSSIEIDESVPASFVATTTIDTARNRAQEVFPDKTITKIELETENGVVVYSVRFSDDSRVDVSASDGSIVRSRNGSTDTRSDDDSSDSSSDDDNSGSQNDDEDDRDDDSDNSNSGRNRDGN